MGVKSRLQALQFRLSNITAKINSALIPVLPFSYREQVEKVSRLRDETVRAIIKNSNDIANFKEEVSHQLKEVKEFAEEN